MHLVQIVRAIGIPDAREASAGNNLTRWSSDGEQRSAATLREVNVTDSDIELVTVRRKFLSCGESFLIRGGVRRNR